MLDMEKIMEITKEMGIEITENPNTKHTIQDSSGEILEINKDTLKKIWDQNNGENRDDNHYKY